MQAGTDTGGARAIATIGAPLFIIGFVTRLDGPLTSFVQLAFTLSDVGALLIPLVFYLSYLSFSLPASWIMNRIGMKRGLALSLLVMAVGSARFVIGGGLSLLQTAINPYISIIGPIESAARRIAIMASATRPPASWPRWCWAPRCCADWERCCPRHPARKVLRSIHEGARA